jgi:prevent-host-death family protein
MVRSNIHEAKSNLSRLIELAVAGEEVIISKAGKPVARLVPYRETKKPRRLGVWKGRVHIAPDFDELPQSIAAAFRGECE